MNILLALSPLLLMFTIVFIAIKFIGSNTNRVPKKTRLTSTFTKGLILVYAIFLISASVTSAFIQPPDPGNVKITDQELTQIHDEVYKNLLEGKEEEVPSKHLLNEWKEKVEGDTFTIQAPNAYDFPLNYMIERIDSSEKVVEARLYEGIHAVNQVKIQDYFKDIQVNWGDDQLSIHVPTKGSDSMAFFQYDFTFDQFNENKNGQNQGMYSSSQYPVLYIKVPNSIEIKMPNIDEGIIHYVK